MDLALRLSMAAAQLDSVSYYELLRVAPDAEFPALQQAFHRFALVYHPDRHVDSSPALRDTARRIFERGVEAYSVLRDPASRSAYDSALAVGHARLSPQEMERVSRAKRTKGQLAPTPRKLGFVDSMSTPEAKEVAERIERLVVEGRYAQAYQQISLLQALEPDNKAIHERSTQLAALARKQASRPYSPK